MLTGICEKIDEGHCRCCIVLARRRRVPQEQVLQGRGARQHRVEVQPKHPVVHAILHPRAIDEDAALEGQA